MATTAQRLAALETALAQQKAWNIAANGRMTALEARAVYDPAHTHDETEPTPTPTPEPAPAPTSTSKVVNVSSIAALKTALVDNTVDEIVVANGTYVVSSAPNQAGSSLWIGSTYASRTRPVLVRAATRGGVTLSGGGSTYWIGLWFGQGAHDQTWDGFTFANAEPTQTGAIVFGAYSGYAAPHHITLRNITMASTLRRTTNGDHGIYFSNSIGGVHDILVEDYTVLAPLSSALQFYHSSAGEPNAWNVTVRRMTVAAGVDRAVALWDSTIRNIVIEDATITGANIGVRYERGGTNVVLRRVTTVNSVNYGFYSSMGANPPGLTREACVFG